MMDIKLLRNIAVVSAFAFSLSGCITAKEMTAPMDGDDDGDGVLNSLDECPNTPAGATVNAQGCEIHLRVDAANFAFDSAELDASELPGLEALVETLQGMSLTAHGYTDSIGTEEYNLGLSERRAAAVAEFMVGMGLPGMNIVGHGEADPIASNDTKEGRAQNRRVEITTAAQ